MVGTGVEALCCGGVAGWRGTGVDDGCGEEGCGMKIKEKYNCSPFESKQNNNNTGNTRETKKTLFCLGYTSTKIRGGKESANLTWFPDNVIYASTRQILDIDILHGASGA